MTTMSPQAASARDALNIGSEALPVDRTIEQAGRIDPIEAYAATNVVVFQRPCGTLAMRRWPHDLENAEDVSVER
jgi:hypothetical protein